MAVPAAFRRRRIPGRHVLGGFRRAATLTTALTGTDNDVVYTAQERGSGGNDITVTYVVSGNSTPLSVDVDGTDITVNVATDGGGSATSTADQVKAAIEGNEDAAALVSVADADGNDGSGVVTAMAEDALEGGTDWVTGFSR